jgi:hypothetical protein
VQNFRLRNGTGITYQDDPTQQSLADFNVTANSPGGTEHGYSLNAGGKPLIETAVDSDGAGGSQNPRLRAPNGIQTNTLSDNGAGVVTINVSGGTRADIDSNGDLRVEGTLTEGAAL